MARIEKTVFISYRRSDVYTALAVYENLKNQGYDVFFDYTSISSGDFEQIITGNIKARAHFLLILTPTALERINEPGDWLRREIEIAIEEKRNIVPLFFRGFRFGTPSASETLTGKLRNLSRYNGMNVHEDFFQEAMQRLRTQYLNIPLDTLLHPVSTEVQKVVKEEQVAADKALEQLEDVEELARQAEEKPVRKKEVPKPVATQEINREASFPAPLKAIPYRLIAGITGALVLTVLCIWGGASLLNYLPRTVPEPINTAQPTQTRTPVPAQIFVSPTETSIPSTPVPTLGIDSTIPSDKDGMILLYVPAGEFTMGSDNGGANEKPVHTVTLDAFWIDKTEVTNQQYAVCVESGACQPPGEIKSYTHAEYYGFSDYDNYPVIYVSWDDAKAYCEWADRRLPSEAEWEKAARGQNAFVYPWGNDFDGDINNFCDTNCPFDWANKNYNDGYADTSPVGNYPNGASFYGVYDMAGNVWEWVNDWYQSDYYSTLGGFTSNPQGPSSGDLKVLRGGAWDDLDNVVRSGFRGWNDPTLADVSIGFRCARSP